MDLAVTKTPAQDPVSVPESQEVQSMPPQHIQALAKANTVRLARASLKREIAGGDAEAADVILGESWETETMSLTELLTAQPRWGRTRARKFLMTLSLAENKPLGSLTKRQRLMIATELQARIPASARALATA